MADSIVRLKVENSEYDAKIKRAAQGLQHLEDACHKAGGTLAILDDADKKFVQSLGRMETVAKSARGRLGELSTAFTDLSVRYNKLTDEEKKGDYGKALSKSLEEIRQRIIDAKGELNDINGRIQNNGSLLDQLSSKFGVSASQLIGWGTAIAAAKGALNVMGDALMNNESTLDEWGRITQSSESVYNSFLNALNNGDIGGFLSTIDTIIQAAREAYDTLDELGTYNAFSQKEKAKNKAGYSEALDNYKRNPTAANKKALEESNRKVIADLTTEQKKTDDAYRKALRQIAFERGLNKKQQDQFVNVFANGSYGDFTKAKAGYSTGRLLNAGAQYWNGNRVYDGRIQEGGKWRDMSAQEKQNFTFARALSQTNDEQIKNLQQLGAQADALRQAAADQNRSFNRMAGNNGTRTTGGGRSGGSNPEIIPAGSIAEAEKKLQDLQKAFREATTPVDRESLSNQINKATAELQLMKKPLEFKIKFIPEDELTKGLASETPSLPSNPLADVLDATGMGASDNGPGSSLSWWLEECRKKADELSKSGEDISRSWANANNAIGSLGSALASIEDPAVKVFSIIAEAIANVALGFSKALAKGKSATIWDWIAGAAAGTATMISTISAIKSATAGNYANGGIIPGNSYSGDNLRMYGVNSGEVVLNQAQTANLATKLSNNAEQRMNAQPYLDCEKLYLGLNTFLGATGRGELITSR